MTERAVDASGVPFAANGPAAGARPVALSTRFYFASGGVATGVINNGFASFVLIYYNQVLGVRPELVGAALALALAFDALSDPIVGYVSDNFHSRWGRRHPFLYFSIVPVTVLFYLLWNPPLAHLGDVSLFVYLLVVSIALRLLLTFYEVPSNALVPELTEDYDARTRLLNARWCIYFFSANGITLAMYGYWLADSPEYPNGLLNPVGYQDMGSIGALIIATTMILASVGLHREIPKLKPLPERRAFSPRRMYAEMYAALSDASLIALLVAGLFYASANGTINALWPYIYDSFWGLSTRQMTLLLVVYTCGSVVAYVATRSLARRREKRTVAVGIAIASAVVTPGVVFLRLAGLMPANDHPWTFPILVAHGLVEISLYIMFTIMLASMMSDLVERRQIRTGRRNEGVLYAAQTFIVKITSGLGAWFAGLGLGLISFPDQTQVDAVPEATIHDLGLVYAPMVFILFGLSAVALTQFRLSRAEHAENLRRLGEADT